MNQPLKKGLSSCDSPFCYLLFVFIFEYGDFLFQADGPVEFSLDFGTGRCVPFADQIDGHQGEDEARHDFIEAEPGELFPDEDREAADDDAGQGPVFGHPFPEQRQEDAGTESCPESGPGVGYHGQDIVIGVEGQVDSQCRHDEDGETADVDQFFVTGFGVDERVVHVFGNSRCRDQKLGRGRAHDGGQDGRPDEARQERREEFLTHDEEDFFRIGSDKRRLQDDFADEADEYGCGQGNDDPGHGDVFGFFQFHGVSDGHEAHQDVGLAKVADAPADGRDDGDDAGHAGVRYELEQLWRISSDPVQYGPQAAVADDAYDGDQDDGQEHHAALDEVRPADGHETAQEGIDDDYAGPNQQGVEVVQAKDSLEQLAAGDESR